MEFTKISVETNGTETGTLHAFVANQSANGALEEAIYFTAD